MQILKNTNIDFVAWRWPALALSLVVIAAGLFTIATRGLQKGVDFEGGTVVVVKFHQPPDVNSIRQAVSSTPTGGDAVVQRYGPPEDNNVMIRVKQTGEETGGDLSREVDTIMAALRSANVGSFDETPVRTDIVGPVVGEQLRRQGIWATVLALGGILIYIGLRFQFSFATGAVVAVVHDLLITLSFLTFFGYDLTLNVIAALLTITGYSVNDTIVVFDRVRENLRIMRRDNLKHIINVAVNQTLARTVITSGTTVFAVLALFLFGGEVLRGMAFTLLVGVISGTYSTVFIAATIAIIFQGKRPLKGQAAPAAATTSPRPSRRRAS